MVEKIVKAVDCFASTENLQKMVKKPKKVLKNFAECGIINI